jgi:hypothetical protein
METLIGSENPSRGQAEGSKTTQFKPGHPGRQPGGRKRRPPSQLLRDMRFVCAQDELKDRTPGQKLCRQILKDDPSWFFTQFAKLESSHEAAKVKVPRGLGAEADEKVDLGTERCVALAQNLIRNLEAERAKKTPSLPSG